MLLWFPYTKGLQVRMCLNVIPFFASECRSISLNKPANWLLKAINTVGIRPRLSLGLVLKLVNLRRAMSNVSDEAIRMIQNRLNNRPRKRLGFKTPAEVFHQSLKRVALRT